MKRKIYWGLAILSILLVVVSVFLLLRNSETEPENVYRPLTPKVAKGSSGRVGSDYPLLIETENPEIMKPIYLRSVDGTGIDIDWESLSPTELAEKIKQAENEELLPPEKYADGYYYVKGNVDRTLLLDERGFPILHKQAEPFITVYWEIEFKPTPEQLVKYNELHRRRNLLNRGTSSPELDAAQSELDEFKRTHTGPVPVTFQISMAVPPEQHMAAQARSYKLQKELHAEMLTHLSLDHLIGFYIK